MTARILSVWPGSIVRESSACAEGDAGCDAAGFAGCDVDVGGAPGAPAKDEPLEAWLGFAGDTDGIGTVLCPTREDDGLAFTGNRDTVPVLEITMRERMALTIFMMPSIPSTSMSATTAFERSSGSSLDGP